jgi:hypothetical protein
MLVLPDRGSFLNYEGVGLGTSEQAGPGWTFSKRTRRRSLEFSDAVATVGLIIRYGVEFMVVYSIQTHPGSLEV